MGQYSQNRDDEPRARFTYHGGNLAAARLAFPEAPGPWIDLSTGINGRPYPVGPVAPEAWTRLPEASAVEALEAAAARRYGAAPDRVVAAPGTQALIQLLPQLLPAARVGILGITYAEHARAWRRAGASVECVAQAGELAGFDVAVVVNPNNPDGRLVPPPVLLGAAPPDGLLIVDEAFTDLVGQDASIAPHLPERGTIVLRSFGKTYGLAGLRLGFAIATPDLEPPVRTALGPWAVSGPAIGIGIRALADDRWLDDTARRLGTDTLRLDALLRAAGATIAGGTPLFRLAEVADATRWFDHLARNAILVRPFTERPTWLRFGIPAEPWHWERLATVLKGLSVL